MGGRREGGGEEEGRERQTTTDGECCVLTHYVGALEVKPIDLQFILTSVKSMR